MKTEELFTRYMRARKNLSENSKKSYEFIYSAYLSKHLSEVDVYLIDDENIADVVEDMDRKGLSSATVNRALRLISSLLGYAMDKRWIKRSIRIKKRRVPKDANLDSKILSEAEEAALLGSVDNMGRRILYTVAVRTGLRLGELDALAWDDVDDKRRIIHVRSGKGAQYRSVPMTEMVRDELDTLRLFAKSEKVFWNLRSYFDGKPVNDHLRDDLIRAGVENSHFTFHGFRHTFATRLLEKGATLADVSRLMGHSSITMTERYLHLTARSPAFDAIGLLD